VLEPEGPLAEHAYSDRRRQQGARSGPSPPPDVDDPNYYELLGVAFDASAAEIRRAYRAAMKEIHPDRQRAAARARAEEQAKLLNRAYATLSKPATRLQYDQTIRAQVIQDQIMSRYVGGFVEQWQDRDGAQLRRTPTAADRREQAQANRGALVSLLTAFVVLMVVVVGFVLLISLGEALVSAVF
jgi:curved DNA-binding protein CbpA